MNRNERIAALMTLHQSDLNAMEWPDNHVKLAVFTAITNALANETRDGMNIANIASFVVPGEEWPHQAEVPSEVQGRALVPWLADSARESGAERVSFSFVDDFENIHTIVLWPTTCWKVQGRIEGTRYVRTILEEHHANGHR